MTEATKAETVLDVKNLQTVFFTNSGLFRAVDDVSFTVHRGETLAIVGESGCGKSVTALSVMRLVPDPPGRVIGGSVELEGTDLLGVSEAEMRSIRGNRISMIFQEPMTSLNPVMRIGDQITEVLRLHQDMTSKEAWAKAVEMLKLVRIPEPQRRAQEYPHQLSGGMRQRVALARTLAVDPTVLLLDEPFSAVDAQTRMVLQRELAQTLKRAGKTALLITHDLLEAVTLSDRVLVMSRRPGRIIDEIAIDIPDRDEPLKRRLHPKVNDYVNRLMDRLDIGAAVA
jgi:peptide/nickel transport system ATP-binding protein